MAQICFKQIKYITNGFTVMEMAQKFDKRLKYVGNEVHMWEFA